MLAAAVVATLAVQLASRRPEGFVDRVAASMAGRAWSSVAIGACGRRSPRRRCGEPIDSEHVELLALELLFIGLLGLASLAIAWVSGVVVYKLFKGQR